jgi:hypothetical protein
MFSYFGSKSKLVKYYPKPKYDIIIEPFAGSAQYAFHYWDKQVILIEKDKAIFDIWDWLINKATYDIIINLPLYKYNEIIDIENKAIKNLISLESFRGCCFRSNNDFAKRKIGNRNRNRWSANNGNGRKRIADNLYKIRHWKIIHGDYSLANNIEATWFIDPPYSNGIGSRYNYNCDSINYTELGKWCKERKGQIIVCEDLLADWLPFEFLHLNIGQYHSIGKNIEAIWTNDK